MFNKELLIVSVDSISGEEMRANLLLQLLAYRDCNLDKYSTYKLTRELVWPSPDPEKEWDQTY